jgi:hypothetical protein
LQAFLQFRLDNPGALPLFLGLLAFLCVRTILVLERGDFSLRQSQFGVRGG